MVSVAPIPVRGPRPTAPRSVGATLRGVGKCFGNGSVAVTAVEDLSLDIEPGQVLGFLGANGAGKSTTMRMLAGILGPTSGVVRVGGGDPRMPEVRRSIGYLPGDLELPPTWTGARALGLFAGLRGSDVDWRPWCERLAFDPTRALGTLSTGNRRKLGVIQAFMCEPPLLLLDEPTSGLDPFLQRTFDELLVEARARGAAILLSSHVLPEVERSADRIAVIHRGRLARLGSLDELRRSSPQRVTISTESEIAPAELERLHAIVDRIEVAPGRRRVTIDVTGPLHPVLGVLTDAGVDRVVSRADDLEDLIAIGSRDGHVAPAHPPSEHRPSEHRPSEHRPSEHRPSEHRSGRTQP